jgi:hypothetical protein
MFLQQGTGRYNLIKTIVNRRIRRFQTLSIFGRLGYLVEDTSRVKIS